MTLRSRSLLTLVAGLVAALLAAALLSTAPAGAADAVNLGTASSYGVLAGSAVTNTGDSVIDGDLGVSPGTAISGFPPGLVSGATHSADAQALQAQSDLVTAYDEASSPPADASVATELGGTTLLPGVYDGATLGITGTVTLDAEGDASAVFIIRAETTLVTATDSAVSLVNGADPCNVFWRIGSSATLGTRTAFQGSILALTSITATTGATVEGRLLARNAAVTLDTNTITVPECGGDETTTVPDSSSTVPGSSTTPETTAPGTTTPGTTTPGTTAPGTTSTTTPGTTAPGTTSPGSTTPGTTSPGSTVPGTTSPGSTVPGTTTPGSTAPSSSTTAPAIITSGGPATPTGPGGPGTPQGPDGPGTPDIETPVPGGPDTPGAGTPVPGGPGPDGPSTSTSLARTGTPLLPVVVAGVASVLLGLVLLVRSRRRAARIGW